PGRTDGFAVTAEAGVVPSLLVASGPPASVHTPVSGSQVLGTVDEGAFGLVVVPPGPVVVVPGCVVVGLVPFVPRGCDDVPGGAAEFGPPGPVSGLLVPGPEVLNVRLIQGA